MRIPLYDSSPASMITRVSPCWVSLAASTCTAFTYGKCNIVWLHVSSILAICIQVLEHVIEASFRVNGQLKLLRSDCIACSDAKERDRQPTLLEHYCPYK